VHLSGGVIEAHFHFFAMVPIVALYESWIPFGLAVGFVLFEHGIVGTLNSSAVYNHDSARDHPWWWASVHALLFASACLGALVNWTLHQRAREVRDQLTQASERDALTGLANHAGVERVGQEALDDGTPLSVLLLDLDNFKDVNDTLGHAGGDVLLTQLGARLRTVVGEDDLLGRLGGDEFVAVLAGRDADGALAAADRLRQALAESFTVQGVSVNVEASAGIATWPPPPSARPPRGTSAVTMSELLRQADVAMYTAKESRSGTAAYEIGQDHEARRRLTFSALRRAINHDQLVVHFQPKTSLSSGAPCGFEALVRWQHPERGLLPPAEFIGTVEQTSLIDQLTEVVMEKALAAVRQWHDAGIRLGVSVNVSPYSLSSPRLLDTVDRLLDEYAVDGRWLCLEITEDVLLVDDAESLSALHKLKRAGVTIAIDDFGSGYSSMSYLQRLPAEELKIDRSLIGGLCALPESGTALQPVPADYAYVIVRSTIELGRSLGLRVVAEGVETVDALATLSSMGCDEVQGYLIAKPMPAESVLPWIATFHPIAVPQQLHAS
jgi:diguanylate cyclase (GGDEF)-like protein